MSGQFLVPIPAAFLKDAGTAEWARQLTLYLDDLSRPEGVLAASATTTTTTAEQATTLVTLQAEMDAVEAQLAALLTSLPSYTITNDNTVRAFNANDAAGAITAPAVLQAEGENIRDAVLVLADVVATLIRDLKNKQILGT